MEEVVSTNQSRSFCTLDDESNLPSTLVIIDAASAANVKSWLLTSLRDFYAFFLVDSTATTGADLPSLLGLGEWMSSLLAAPN